MVTQLGRRVTLGLCVLMLGAGVARCDPAAAQARTPTLISVPDLVRMAIVGDPLSLSWNEYDGINEAWSTDRRRVALVLRYGNTENGTNDADLLVYESDVLLTAPKPKSVLHFASSSNHQPLAFVRWLADGDKLLAAGTEAGKLSQVFEVNVATGVVLQRTQVATAMLSFDATSSGSRIVTFSERNPTLPPSEDPACRTNGCLVTAETLFEAETGIHNRSSPTIAVFYRGAKNAKTLPAPEEIVGGVGKCNDRAIGGLAPNGRFILLSCSSREGQWPTWWKDYGGRAVGDPAALKRANPLYARRLVIVDLDSGRMTPVSSAPYIPWGQVSPLWIDGGRAFVLPGVLEPLDIDDPRERAQRQTQLAIWVADAATARSERIARLGVRISKVSALHWDESKQLLDLDTADVNGKSLGGLRFRRRHFNWTAETGSPAKYAMTAQAPQKPSGPIALVLKQSLNDPPLLVAFDNKSGRNHTVLDPNPWLADRRLGRVELIKLTVGPDCELQGGLYYPPMYERGKRYPLLIQTHGFDAERFSLTGYSRNFAGQAAAAYGMMVLQLEEPNACHVNATPKEWPTVQREFEAAIDYLDGRGLIDRSRVGIQGWSRTGPHVGYTLTHSSYRFAAAAFSSTGDFGWWWYLSAGAYREVEADYGAAPFGEGLNVWHQYSPTFNLERVTTPMIMWSEQSVAGLWDWYAGLRRLNKPVEYWLLPDGVHESFKVQERIATVGLFVDWFRFWLQGEEDRNVNKAVQYARWRAMRTQQQVNEGAK